MSLKDGKMRRAYWDTTRAGETDDLIITDSWPSSAAFDAISSALSDEAERKDAVKKGGAIFAFTLKNAGGETKDWYIDLKETGTVGQGTAPEGKKANGRFMPLLDDVQATPATRAAILSFWSCTIWP